jgi:hypothetical protein
MGGEPVFAPWNLFHCGAVCAKGSESHVANAALGEQNGFVVNVLIAMTTSKPCDTLNRLICKPGQKRSRPSRRLKHLARVLNGLGMGRFEHET